MDKSKFKSVKFDFMKDTMKDFHKDHLKQRAQYPVISECPVCKQDLHVHRLKCSHCDTVIEGEFTLSKFNYLDTEQLYFIEVFVKNRGNIKAIEKEMDLSYPTIKKMLDDVILGLGYKPDSGEDTPPIKEKDKEKEPTEPKASKLDILEKINSGELNVEAALDLIKKLKL
jgi:hypothetical protein